MVAMQMHVVMSGAVILSAQLDIAALRTMQVSRLQTCSSAVKHVHVMAAKCVELFLTNVRSVNQDSDSVRSRSSAKRVLPPIAIPVWMTWQCVILARLAITPAMPRARAPRARTQRVCLALQILSRAMRVPQVSDSTHSPVIASLVLLMDVPLVVRPSRCATLARMVSHSMQQQALVSYRHAHCQTATHATRTVSPLVMCVRMVITLMLQMAVANLAWRKTVSRAMLTLRLATHARTIMASIW